MKPVAAATIFVVPHLALGQTAPASTMDCAQMQEPGALPPSTHALQDYCARQQASKTAYSHEHERALEKGRERLTALQKRYAGANGAKRSALSRQIDVQKAQISQLDEARDAHVERLHGADQLHRARTHLLTTQQRANLDAHRLLPSETPAPTARPAMPRGG